MENLVKTTNLRFRTSKNGFAADVYAVKDKDGNVISLNINSVSDGNRDFGYLSLTGEAVTQAEGIAALVAQALGEAASEGNVESNEGEE